MTEFEDRTAVDLRRALEEHRTIAQPRYGVDGPAVLRRWFPRYVLRKLGWVAWNAEPDAPLKYVRLKEAQG